MADAMLYEKNGTVKPAESEDSAKKATKKSTTKQSEKKDNAKKSSRSSDRASSPPKTKTSKSHASVTTRETNVEVDPAGLTSTSDVTLGDVMSFLQSIKNDQNKSDKRLDALSAKVDDLYENYDEDELLYDDNVEDIGQNDSDENNNSQPPAKKQKTVDVQSKGTEPATDNHDNDASSGIGTSKSNVGHFKELVEKFKVKEKVDASVDADLAELVNSFFQNGLPDHQLSDLLKNIHRPENCTMLTKTRVNQLIWDVLSDYTRIEENKIQYRQGLLIKASILITKLLNKLSECKKEENADFPIQELMNLGTDALGLLGHCNRSTNLARRELHRPDMSYDYFHLCSSTVPYTEFLYGDDISKKVSDIDSVNKVGRKVSRGRGYGYRIPRRRLGRMGSRRGAGRGRGTLRGSLRGREKDSGRNDYNAPGPSRYDFPKNSRRGYNRRQNY